MYRKKTISFVLLLCVIGCSHSTSSVPVWPPSIGSSYTVVSVYTTASQTLYDTLVVSVDGVNVPFMGRNAVSRLIRSRAGQVQDTLYINYLVSGDIETFLQSQHTGPKKWVLSTYATQRPMTLTLDTSWSTGTITRSHIETAYITGAGSGIESINGNSISDQRLSIVDSVILDGELNYSYGVTSYIPSLGYLGFSSDTISSGGPASISSTRILTYNLR